MLSLGPGELVLVSVALLLIFSSGRLGAMGDALGRLLGGKRPADPSGSVGASGSKPGSTGSN